MLNLTEYNRRFNNKKPIKRRSLLLRYFPVSIVLVIIAGYVPMIFLLVQDKDDAINHRQADSGIFPDDPNNYMKNEAKESENLIQQNYAQNHQYNPKFPNQEQQSDETIKNVVVKPDIPNIKPKAVKPNIVELPSPSKPVNQYKKPAPKQPTNHHVKTVNNPKKEFIDTGAIRGASKGQSVNKPKRVDLHRDPDESARLMAEYHERIEERKNPKTTEAPKRRTVPVFDEKRMEYALRQYQLAVQRDKRKERDQPAAVVGVVAREEHLRQVQHEQVLVASVEHDVLGNYEPLAKPSGKGPGEGGKAVNNNDLNLGDIETSMRDYGFNLPASDVIALNRTVKDTRHQQCRSWKYPSELPSASVVIVYHNEGWSTLLRTIHSVVRTAPARLLHELILVDDYSDKGHIKLNLDQYIATFESLRHVVRVIHSPHRLGSIQARMLGARQASASVLVFLDAHCECNINWLPPLLSRIAVDRMTLAVPVTDKIDARTFEYSAVHLQHYRGIWDWGLLYKEAAVPVQEVNSWQYITSPYQTPTHSGGLLAVDRKYFFELGGFDPGLEIWGGENFEISFKAWMCGGKVEMVPCSRIGHIYRSNIPYTMGGRLGPVTQKNYLRVVETWMDEKHKNYFYTREPILRGVQYGDINTQLAFKRTHSCKSFDWFMNHVANDVYSLYPPPPENFRWGAIKEEDGRLCWDTKDATYFMGFIQLGTCSESNLNQVFKLNIEGKLSIGEMCVELHYSKLSLAQCKRGSVDGYWQYHTSTGLLEHTEMQLCMQSDKQTRKITVAKCNASDKRQSWRINKVYPYKPFMAPEYLRKQGIKTS